MHRARCGRTVAGTRRQPRRQAGTERPPDRGRRPDVPPASRLERREAAPVRDAVTRPTPRAPQLAVRRSTSVLRSALAVAGASALSGCQLTLPVADDGALPAGRRRDRHPGRGQRATTSWSSPAAKGQPGVLSGQIVNSGGQAGDGHLHRAGGRRSHQAGRGAGSTASLSGEVRRRAPSTLPSVSVEPGSLLEPARSARAPPRGPTVRRRARADCRARTTRTHHPDAGADAPRRPPRPARRRARPPATALRAPTRRAGRARGVRRAQAASNL